MYKNNKNMSKTARAQSDMSFHCAFKSENSKKAVLHLEAASPAAKTDIGGCKFNSIVLL